jgi:hypothetical protein
VNPVYSGVKHNLFSGSTGIPADVHYESLVIVSLTDSSYIIISRNMLPLNAVFPSVELRSYAVKIE